MNSSEKIETKVAGFEPVLSWREKSAYAFGNLASVLYWQTFMAYLAFFYTDVFGLSAAVTACMLGLSRSIDAFVDPAMGMLADRTETRWGKFRPYLLWLCVPMAIVGVFTFTTPGWSPSAKLAWAIVTYNALMLIYTGINIPYVAMVGVVTPNPSERASLSSSMLIGAFTAGNIISWTLLPLVNALGGRNAQAGWRNAFVLIGVVAIGCFLVTFFNTRERVRPPQAQANPIGRDVRDLFTNAPWLILLMTMISFILFGAVRTSVSVHYFKYFVGTQTVSLPSFLPWIGGERKWTFEYLTSVFNGSGQAASIVGVLLLPWLAKRWSSKAIYVVCFCIAIASTAACYFLRPNQVGLILCSNLLITTISGLLIALVWPMCADTADYAEWKKGRRATGLVLSASILAQKQGWAIGAWLAMGLLGHFGFVANQAPSASSVRGLVLLMSFIPAAIGAVSVVTILFYPLTESRIRQISAELKVRRAALGDETAT